MQNLTQDELRDWSEKFNYLARKAKDVPLKEKLAYLEASIAMDKILLERLKKEASDKCRQ